MKACGKIGLVVVQPEDKKLRRREDAKPCLQEDAIEPLDELLGLMKGLPRASPDSAPGATAVVKGAHIRPGHGAKGRRARRAEPVVDGVASVVVPVRGVVARGWFSQHEQKSHLWLEPPEDVR